MSTEPVQALEPGEKPIVLCVRHPDYANDFTVHGDVRIIDIDLGGGMDITHGVERDVAAEYIWSWRNQVRDLPRDHPIRRDVYGAIWSVIEAAHKK